MLIRTLVISALFAVAVADVSTTVYCRNDCKEYNDIEDANMPACDQAFRNQHHSCGTVISCDPKDGLKQRAPVNASTAICCFHTEIKEKGDCMVPPPPEEVQRHADQPTADPIGGSPMLCFTATLPWVLVALLLVVVICQFAGLIYLLQGNASGMRMPLGGGGGGGCHGKIAHWNHHDIATQPILLARPLPLLA